MANVPVTRVVLTALLLAGAAAACTVKQTEVPAITGPSDLTASPLTPTAGFVFSPSSPVTDHPVGFDASASCAVGGCAATGHAIVSYAWNFGDGALASGRVVSHNFAAASRFNVTLTVTNDAGMAALTNTLVSVDVATPPTAAFVFSPNSPVPRQTVTFNAGSSAPARSRTIASYDWNFGDGGSGSGVTPTHAYNGAGTYNIVLTVIDDLGQRATATNAITVVPPAVVPKPTAAFVFSPAAPNIGQSVSFNGSASTAAPGHSIVSYDWNFGDGGTANGVTSAHSFGTAGAYNVVLVVTDDLGQTGTATSSVPVGTPTSPAPPTANFTFSPASPGVGTAVVFDTASSSAAPGQSIARFDWNFGDGSAIVTCYVPSQAGDNAACSGGSNRTINHAYAAAGTFTVNLIVSDGGGRTGTKNTTVTVK